MQRFERGAVVSGELLRVGAEPFAHRREHARGIGGSGARKQRIGMAVGLRMDYDSATGQQRFGEGSAGFNRPLVLVGPDVDAACVLAAIGAEQVLARRATRDSKSPSVG